MEVCDDAVLSGIILVADQLQNLVQILDALLDGDLTKE